ncbi:MAG TPA: hypothetical protein VK983_05635 [Candidatus Limnocylindrales bacterium]|nr:hypothetical protein [Candidatus Limnocylindrales bacterium]
MSSPEFSSNLYSMVPPAEINGPRTYEEALVMRFGGEPDEWTHEAEILQRQFDERLASGEPIGMLSSEPLAEGIFSGFHELQILRLEEQEPAGGSIKIRKVYLTSDQARSGAFQIPKTGIFALDAPLQD